MRFAKPRLVQLVALPLGNSEDLSPRARAALESAEVVFCEDTRRLQNLRARVGVKNEARLVTLPGDTERDFHWDRIFAQHPGASVALVSDAGTPVVNDPGRELLRFCFENQIPVEALPGPSAPILAWQWSGGFGLPFVFAGFAPKAKSAGVVALEEFFQPALGAGTFVYFDTRHQVLVTLEHLRQKGWGARRLFVAREMTKSHEELLRGDVETCARELAQRLEKADAAIGEMTFVLEGGPGSEVSAGASASFEDLISLRTLPPKEAAKVLARLSGKSVKEAYSALTAKNADSS